MTVTPPKGNLRRSIVGSILAGTLILTLTGLISGSSGAAPIQATDSGSAGPAYSQTKTLTRTNPPVKGQTQNDSRTVSVTVDQTQNLRERQVIDVSWTGAHPTAGIGAATTDPSARFQEYPVMVVECRGQDSSSVPPSEQVTPRTCWTGTPQERVFETGGDLTRAVWMQDRYASAADRASLVGIPSPLPAACGSVVTSPAYWLHFIAAGGTDYPIGDITSAGTGCAGNPPEMTNALFQQSLEPTNTTYAITDTSGAGSTKFVISTAESNASLGCSPTVACTLEVIPIMGISCDPNASGAYLTNCSTAGDEAPGSEAPVGDDPNGLAVQGTLWWAASNWQGRFAVPLTFAPSSGGCSASGATPLDMYGSELMIQATQQWQPYFCSNPSLFPFEHVYTSDVEAKNLLNNGGIEAAIQGEPPPNGFETPTVQAPIGVTGFAIGYSITYGNRHTAYHELKLTPRLLAKLLTESYPEDPTIQSGDPGLANNPLNILHDPEFQALNPQIGNSGYPAEPPATLYIPSGDEDAMWALTSYINSDPEARAWLNGAPDPWGMTVNPAYKGIQLPVTSWPLLDTYASGFLYTSGNNQCLQFAPHPVPWLSLVASPVSSLEEVSLNLQFTIDPSQTVCGGVPGALNLVSVGPESPSFNQWQMSLVPLGDVSQYAFDAASLQTEVSAGAASKFTDAGGRTFVGPSAASLQAAASLLTPDQTRGTWDLPYSEFHSGGIAAAAYPGTMLMSLDVPLTGLASSDAKDYAQFLQFAATTGQTQGSGVGQLPAGFLPMTSANGLAAQAAYTVSAAQAVAAQSGSVPPLIPSPPIPSTTTTTSDSTITSTSVPSVTANATAGNRNDVSTQAAGSNLTAPTTSGQSKRPSGSGSSVPSRSSGTSGATSTTTTGMTQIEPAAGRTPSIGSGVAGWAFPIALMCGLMAIGSRLLLRLVAPRGSK